MFTSKPRRSHGAMRQLHQTEEGMQFLSSRPVWGYGTKAKERDSIERSNRLLAIISACACPFSAEFSPG
jgi:hypothetical protein